MKKTYWFSVVSGETYEKLFDDLNKSAHKFNIEIDKIQQDNEACLTDFNSQKSVKKNKINGILNTPDGYDRIIYIDADTLINDIDSINNVNGALMEPWGMGKVPMVSQHDGFFRSYKRKKKLWELLKKSNLDIFCPGGRYHTQEWNSGIIIGDRKFLEELALSWDKWWNIINDINDGVFRRDQMSFKYAYYETAIKKYQFQSLPVSYNWIVRRMGDNPTAHILHKAGSKNQSLELTWEIIRRRVLDL